MVRLPAGHSKLCVEDDPPTGLLRSRQQTTTVRSRSRTSQPASPLLITAQALSDNAERKRFFLFFLSLLLAASGKLTISGKDAPRAYMAGISGGKESLRNTKTMRRHLTIFELSARACRRSPARHTLQCSCSLNYECGTSTVRFCRPGNGRVPR